MNERLIVDVYFSDKNGLLPDAIGDLSPGTIDEFGNIAVCGAEYPCIGGVKTNFVDRNEVEHNIRHVLVDYRDFPEIAIALSENEVEFGPTDVEKMPEPSI